MIIIVIILVFWIIVELMRAPIFKISKNDIIEIKKVGLLHFTSKENAEQIKKEGLKGNVSHMVGLERRLGKLIWMYKNNYDIDILHKDIVNKKRGKEDPNRYNICLKVEGLTEKDFEKLYKRIGFGGKYIVIYRGEKIVPNKVTIVKEWT